MKRIIFCAVLVVIFSCRKKDSEHDTVPAGLTLNLHQSALTIQDVDSADVVFRRAGTNETVRERFVKQADELWASLKSLTPGTWNADVEVYTKAVNNQNIQYKLMKSILIPNEQTTLEITGPGSAPGNGWLKRHVKRSTGNEIVVIVPDDVYDSYFEFRANTNGKYFFGIQREAVNTNFVVAMKTWACTDACFTGQRQLTNIAHFMPFTQTIFSSPWTRNDISIAVLNERQELILEYDRRWLQ